MANLPPIVALVGKKKSGKTTVAVKLVSELSARSYKVMTIKHGHHFDLDTPGTDSWRHRVEAGAQRVVLAGPNGVAIVGSWPDGESASPIDLVARYLADAHIVVLEGFKHSTVPKIEIFRRGAHAAPIFSVADAVGNNVIAVVTDHPESFVRSTIPVFDIDSAALAGDLVNFLEAHLAPALVIRR